jgi:hypothetical protein
MFTGGSLYRCIAAWTNTTPKINVPSRMKRIAARIANLSLLRIM